MSGLATSEIPAKVHCLNKQNLDIIKQSQKTHNKYEKSFKRPFSDRLCLILLSGTISQGPKNFTKKFLDFGHEKRAASKWDRKFEP